MSGNHPWPETLCNKFAALLLDGSVMQQCLLTRKQVILTRVVLIVFLPPSSLDVYFLHLKSCFL